MAGGLAIVLLTVLAVFAFVVIIMSIDSIFGWVLNLFKRSSWLVRIVLAIPLVCLFVLSLTSGIFVIILMVFGIYAVATGTRNWWHKGH